MRAGMRFLSLVLTAAIALVLAAGPSARAGLLQCFEVIAPLDEARKAVEIAATAGACTSAATTDPLMAITIAAITAGAIGGAYSTSGQCKARINGVAGKLIAEAILAAPPTRALLSEQQKLWLRAFIAGNSAVSLTEIISQVPALAALNLYMACGCAVAGVPGDLKKIAAEYADAAASCANFAEDAVATIGGALGSGFESIHEALHGPALTPGIQMETECPTYYVPVGFWKKGQISTHREYNERGRSICGRTVCPKDTYILERKAAGGAIESSCTTHCLPVAKTFVPGGLCYYTDYYDTENGRCSVVQSDGECACQPGQGVFEWGKCSPRCRQGVEIFNEDAGTCIECTGATHPIYSTPASSAGRCESCPFGARYSTSAFACRCPPGEIVAEFTMNTVRYRYCDRDTGCGGTAVRGKDGECAPCNAGFYPRANKCVAAQEIRAILTGVVTVGTPSCGSGQSWDGRSCVALCAPNLQRDPRTGRCVSPVRIPERDELVPVLRLPVGPTPVDPSPVAPSVVNPQPFDPAAIIPGFILPGLLAPGQSIPAAPSPVPVVPQGNVLGAQPQFQIQSAPQLQPFLNQQNLQGVPR